MSNRGLPSRFFREGPEPNGERVHSYSELSYIDDITAALLPEEREKLQNSQFGKLLQIPEGAAFSGKLIHFLLTRQLIVKKKHEIWIVFAGSPIRFSISEFQSLTRLNCTKLAIPKKKKPGKRKIVPGKYWFKLFDRPEVSVEWVVNRLKKNLVGDRDTRLRFALLALVDGVICPTSGKSKICPIHADLSEDIDKFLNYPWGTTSFHMTLTSIQARGRAKLRKKSVTLQGFPYALQLLLLKAVPVIKELHFHKEDMSEDSDLEDITNDIGRLWTMKLDIVWKVDGKSSCPVTHLMEGPNTPSIWSDDEDDDSVATLLQHIQRGKIFTSSMFGGGLLPDEGIDERDTNSDNGSSDETTHETNGSKKRRVPSNGQKGQGQREISIQDSMKHYVDMKVKRSENRVLKAIAEVELRLSNSIAKSISQAQLCKDCMHKPVGEACPGNNHHSDPKLNEAAVAVGVGINNQSSGTENPNDEVITTFRKTDDGGTVKQKKSTKSTGQSSLKRKKLQNSSDDDCNDKDGPAVFDDVLEHSSFVLPSPKRPAINISEAPRPTHIKDSAPMVTSFGSFQVPFTKIFPSQDDRSVSITQTPTKTTLPVTDKQSAEEAACNDLFGGAAWPKPYRSEIGTKNQSTTAPSNKDANQPPQAEIEDRLLEENDGLALVPYAGTEAFPEATVNAIVPSNSFGYELQQLQKIIRITTPESLIDFGGDRKLTSSAVRNIIELKTDLTNEETDILYNSLRHSWETHPPKDGTHPATFRDSTFGISIIQHYQKFRNSSEKGMYEFDNSLITDYPVGIEKFYFPFVFEKRHWVCLCVDLDEWAITVLDCFASASREPKIKTSLKPLAIMIPYLARFAASQSGKKGVDYKPLGILREKGIPQATKRCHSGVMSANLGEAHALGGVALCKLLNITSVFDSAKKYIIDAYETANGPA